MCGSGSLGSVFPIERRAARYDKPHKNWEERNVQVLCCNHGLDALVVSQFFRLSFGCLEARSLRSVIASDIEQ